MKPSLARACTNTQQNIVMYSWRPRHIIKSDYEMRQVQLLSICVCTADFVWLTKCEKTAPHK